MSSGLDNPPVDEGGPRAASAPAVARPRVSRLDAASRVVLLLESIGDLLPAAAIANLNGSSGHGVRGSVALELHPLYRRGSYRELERRLRELRELERDWHRAVVGRYLATERRVMVLPVVRNRWGARVVLPDRCELAGGIAAIAGKSARVVVRRWSEGVSLEAAGAGVGWLAGRMYGGDAGRIVVPRELVGLEG